jgi:hypothetical protein
LLERDAPSPRGQPVTAVERGITGGRCLSVAALSKNDPSQERAKGNRHADKRRSAEIDRTGPPPACSAGPARKAAQAAIGIFCIS